jgi:hypothetical protein
MGSNRGRGGVLSLGMGREPPSLSILRRSGPFCPPRPGARSTLELPSSKRHWLARLRHASGQAERQQRDGDGNGASHVDYPMAMRR